MKPRSRTASSETAPTAIDRLAANATRLSDVVLFANDAGDINAERQHPNSAMHRSQADFLRLTQTALNSARADPEDIAALLNALGAEKHVKLPARMLAGNMVIREEAYQQLFRTLRAAWRGPLESTRRWFFGTLITDLGNSLEYAPVIELARLKQKFWKVVARTRLHSFIVIETQAGTNYPRRGHGLTLMTHAHFIGFTDDPAFDLQSATRSALQGTTLSNWLDAPTVKIREICSVEDLRRDCYYINKMPAKASRIVPDAWMPSGFATKAVEAPAQMALRLAEVITQLDYMEIVFSTGDGKKLKGEWRDAMKAWHAPRRADDEVDLAAAFERVWRRSRSNIVRSAIDIRRDASQPPDTGWQDVMAGFTADAAENRRASKKLTGKRQRIIKPFARDDL